MLQSETDLILGAAYAGLANIRYFHGAENYMPILSAPFCPPDHINRNSFHGPVDAERLAISFGDL